MEGLKKKIALVGAGPWGKNHLKNLLELGVLHSVLENSSHRINELKKDFPGVNFVTNENDIINNPEIEAVVIAVPAFLHFPLTKKYLFSGKDVLVEKPLALTVKDGEELLDIAGKKNKILMVGHLLQYHPAIIKLRELITEGELGKIRYIYSNRLNIGRLRTEENVLWSFAPHDISLILMLMDNEKPVHVSAFGGAYINPTVYDTTLTVLEFENRVKAHIFVSWLHPYKEQKLVVVGSRKMAVFDDITKEKLFLYPHEIEFKNGKIPVAHRADYIAIDFPSRQPLKEELLHFIDCMKNRTQPKTDGREGIRVLKVLEKAEKTLKSGSEDSFSGNE
jgi:UDP-2-acetamido-3-amino-2,3-dideoxy-glucuronate N-acetyltransferase